MTLDALVNGLVSLTPGRRMCCTTVYALFPMDMTRPADGNDSSGPPVIRGGKSGLLFLRSPGSAGQVFLQANLDQEAHDAIQVRKAADVWLLGLRLSDWCVGPSLALRCRWR